ncbi:restriction endonuclease subunit S [Enterococcus faecium]|uniref:restriction endonuclease subunit S n=1 Tax=Enterococcus faecium TaxID=1352 RepID=UPI002DBD549D|nr:restriction endonuclease subunit S [Enterococcus faecium]MEB7470779.1 restriction endonuclease subunit S [Enterococcus faecium]
MIYKVLSDFSSYVNERIPVEKLNLNNYISTENMLQNKNGIVKSAKLPTTKSVVSYQKGDILISNIRPYFKKIWYANKNGGCSNDVLVIRAHENYNSKFLYYILSSDNFFDYVMSMSKGTKMPRGDKSAIMQYSIPNLSSKEQFEISETLSSIDKLININSKINHHLSVIVQAIFNSWFVDYVPFGGTLPSEWKEVDFDEISTVQNGYAFKSKDYVSDGVRMIRTTNFDNGYVNNNDLIMLPSEFYNDAKYRNFVLKKFDTVLVMVGASVGKISLITELNTPALQNQNMWRFRSIIPEIPESFIHFNVKRINDQVRGWSSGSARDFYRKDIFKKAKVYLPTSQVLDDFSKITMPIFEQISNNILENDKLIKARDSLLPKLMSGEVSVTD